MKSWQPPTRFTQPEQDSSLALDEHLVSFVVSFCSLLYEEFQSHVPLILELTHLIKQQNMRI